MSGEAPSDPEGDNIREGPVGMIGTIPPPISSALPRPDRGRQVSQLPEARMTCGTLRDAGSSPFPGFAIST